MWDRFITYLLSGLAPLAAGSIPDHFRCLVPDREVMAACKQWAPQPWNVCVCVGVRIEQESSAVTPTRGRVFASTRSG